MDFMVCQCRSISCNMSHLMVVVDNGVSVHMWGRENMGNLYLLTFVVNLKLL